MPNHNKYSKTLHFLTFLCFLLPFFYIKGCDTVGSGLSDEVKTKDGIAAQDSIQAMPTVELDTARQDSSTTNSIDTVVNEQSQIDTPSKPEEETGFISQRISDNVPFLQPILNPESKTYSGIAGVIDTIPFVPFFAIFLAFLLLIFGLLVKYIANDAKKTIVLLDSLAFVILLFSRQSPLYDVTLWGFWTCVALIGALTLYDLYLAKQTKQPDKRD